MYDLKDKIIARKIETVHPKLFINKEYVPFSLLFDLSPNPSSFTMKELLKYYKDREYSIADIKITESYLKKWLENIPSQIVLTRQQVDLTSKLYSALTTELPFRTTYNRRSGFRYLKGYYSLLTNEVQSQCYFILMVKKTHVKYVKLCALLEETILEDCIEFWYDEKLIATDTSTAQIPAKLLKKILKEFKDKDVPCFNKEGIIDLLTPKIEFKALTISGQKELINEFAKEFQTQEIEQIRK